MPEYLNSRPSKLGDYRLPREVDVIGDGKEGEKKREWVPDYLPPEQFLPLPLPPVAPATNCGTNYLF